jgi:hypothetical protein
MDFETMKALNLSKPVTKTEEKLPLEVCGKGRFKNQDETANSLGITGGFLCPKANFSIDLFGSSSS